MKRRLDAELVARGLATSRGHAQDLIDAKRVTVSGAPGLKASRQVDSGEPINVSGPPPRFVCLLYTSPSPRDATLSRMPSSA